MKKKGHELKFIGQINRDGSGIGDISETYISFLQKDDFRLHRLSITQGTYIAFNFNAFVVKLKV